MIIQRLIDIFGVDISKPDFYIQGINIPSKKNSKRWTGTHVISSAVVQKFERNTPIIFRAQKDRFLGAANAAPKPILLGILFIRDTKREFDYNNISQIILDEFTKHGYIRDDNMNEIVPIFLGYEVDKLNCGVRCYIL